MHKFLNVSQLFAHNKIMVYWNSWLVCIYSPALKTFIKQSWQIVYLKVHKMDQFFPNTLFSALIPGWFVTCNRTRSSWLGYKLGCIAWNSFHLKRFVVSLQAAYISFPFWTKGCLFPSGSKSISGSGCQQHIALTSLTEGDTKVVFSTLVQLLSFVLLFLDGPFSEFNWSGWKGEACGNILFQHCCIASVALLFGSGFHATYFFLHIVEVDGRALTDAKRFTVG